MNALLTSFLNALKPLFSILFLRNGEKTFQAENRAQSAPLSGMVTDFNWLSDSIFTSFFRRVRTLETDFDKIKTAANCGPIVFVTKNNGSFEYRYFNWLFLKQDLPAVRFATLSSTLLWWPLREIFKLMRGHLSLYYKNPSPYRRSDAESIAHHLGQGEHVLINVKISRDYIFGLLDKSPMETLFSLFDFQSQSEKEIHLIPVQFLYDKHPEKTQRSFFDFLFGEKSCPGSLRKFVLFLMNYRKNPQAKFGTPVSLKQHMAKTSQTPKTEQVEQLLSDIETDLSIERARITGPKLVSKETILGEILETPEFTSVLEEMASQSGQGLTGIKTKARKYLTEIAADVNYSYVHMVALVLDYLWENIYDGVVIKHDQLNRIREVAGKNPIVLVPMHRSHIDYLLISHIFYNHNITFPHVCAGNNMNFWPIGRLVRKCGGFFIRRSFSGNDLYKESLYGYIKALLKKSFCLEFFIEGTRSRTGKMIRPKFGILSQIVRAYLEGACEDISFVPIAINYDQIIEQKAYRAESHGGKKKTENATELVKARKVLGKKYGKVYIEFAPHISLKDYLDQKERPAKPDTSQTRALVEDFGYHLTYHMNKAALITPTSLVALAALSFANRSFTFEQLNSRIHVLREYLDHKDVIYSDLINYSDRWAFSEAVTLLKNKGILREMQTFENSLFTADGNSLIQLDYYKNNILHFFVSLVCTLKILLPLKPGESLTMNEMAKRYERLKTVFEEDFMFSSREPLKNHIRRVLDYCEKHGLIVTSGSFETIKREPCQDHMASLTILSTLLDNFLESHLITLRYLKTQSLGDVEKNHIIRDILEKAKPLYLTGELKHPEALTRFNLENSVNLCTKIGLLRATSRQREKILYSTVEETSHVERWISFMNELLAVSGKIQTPVSANTPVQPLNAPGGDQPGQGGWH